MKYNKTSSNNQSGHATNKLELTQQSWKHYPECKVVQHLYCRQFAEKYYFFSCWPPYHVRIWQKGTGQMFSEHVIW